MTPEPSKALRLRIDRDALVRNWQAMDRLSGDAATGAAVKADCYGLGVDTCVPALRDAGARHFFVAHWGEVRAASAHVPASAIAVLGGPLDSADVAFAKATDAVPVINSLAQARRWKEAGGGRCHLMVDTGMNRLGIRPDLLGDPVIASLTIDMLMSHLACADEDSTMNARQLAAFEQVLAAVPHKTASLANSAGIALGARYRFGMTRPGLALYGGVPRAELSDTIAQVVVPETRVLQVRNVPSGESVGYGATFTAQHDMRVATLAIGYADGFLRRWDGKGVFTAGGARLPVLGRVSMDLCAVDLAGAPDVGEGDWVALEYDLPRAAMTSGLTQYELLTVLGPRLKWR